MRRAPAEAPRGDRIYMVRFLPVGGYGGKNTVFSSKVPKKHPKVCCIQGNFGKNCENCTKITLAEG